MKSFFVGLITGWIVLIAAAFVFVWMGGMPVATSSPPLPFEKLIAKTALRAAYRGADRLHPSIDASEANILAGAKLYRNDCAFCHGLPDQNNQTASVSFFPPPPQLYRHGVDDDPIGETYLKVKNGIRLSAMPSFSKVYSDEQLWQVSLLLSRGKDLPANVKEELLKK